MQIRSNHTWAPHHTRCQCSPVRPCRDTSITSNISSTSLQNSATSSWSTSKTIHQHPALWILLLESTGTAGWGGFPTNFPTVMFFLPWCSNNPLGHPWQAPGAQGLMTRPTCHKHASDFSAKSSSNSWPSPSPDFPYKYLCCCWYKLQRGFVSFPLWAWWSTAPCNWIVSSAQDTFPGRGGRKGKKKKGKASGQTIDYGSELQGAIDFSLNTMYCCKAEKK